MCFLGHRIQVIIFTLLDGVVSSRDGQNTVGLQPCSHEEADTMKMHPMYCGLKMVTITTVGTDVFVLAVVHFHGLPNIEQLWIAFGTCKEFKYIQIHNISSAISAQFAMECCSFIHSPAAT